MKNIVIYGAGEHGCVVCATLNQGKAYHILGFLDDNAVAGDKRLGVKVLGTMDEQLDFLHQKQAAVALAIGSISSRKSILNRVKEAELELATIIDSSAKIYQPLAIGLGTYIGAGAIVHVNSNLAEAVLIDNGAIISHDCQIGECSEISVGALLGGGVMVEENVFIGMGAVIRDHIHIGKNSVIGAGAVVIADIPENVVAFGVPARPRECK